MNGRNFAYLLASLVAIAAVLVLALSNERPISIGTPYEDFLVHRDFWSAKRPANYSVDVDKTCLCRLWSVRVTVSGADVSSVEYRIKPEDPAPLADRRYYPRDIDTLFEIIDSAYAARAYSIEIVFDDTYGYPARVFVDRDRDVIDDEYTFELSSFSPIQPG